MKLEILSLLELLQEYFDCASNGSGIEEWRGLFNPLLPFGLLGRVSDNCGSDCGSPFEDPTTSGIVIAILI